ncbi:MFS transporter [Amorphoplanes nipponensis]|uniref:MFS transporter n=1 Tax=Actinoplanes nipponensis TaxID=135950 RepID=A0A919JCI1_9ACTN|nr:MFS transporter [Actinoplanes nipponensis]GIE47072.1 MFS transporter [Actinoplanes nipponensis]
MRAALRSLDLVPAAGPGRRMVLVTVVQSGGSGLFLTSSAVFFVRVVGLEPGQLGLGLSLAGLAGFLVTVPIGRLADRHGARRLLAVNHLVLALLFALYPLAGGFPSFVVLASLIAMAEISASPLRSATLHSLLPAAEAVRTRAQMRSGFNIGFLLGAGLAAVVLAAPSHATFWAVCLTNALAQAACGVAVWRLRPSTVPQDHNGPRSGGAPLGHALRDTRFVLLTMANGVLELHSTVLTLGLPLWIISRHAAPASLVSLFIVVNTVIVVLLQVRLTRGAGSVAGAAALERRAGLVLAAGCVVCAISSGLGTAAGTTALVAGTVILSVGEIWQAGGGWGLAFELPPPGRQGEYQAVFGLGRGIAQFLGPALVTTLVVGAGAIGWLVLAGLFLLTGFACWWLAVGGREPQTTVPLTAELG